MYIFLKINKIFEASINILRRKYKFQKKEILKDIKINKIPLCQFSVIHSNVLYVL